MKALDFRRPGRIAWQDVPDPTADVPDPTVNDAADAVIRVHVVTVRGTDLHIIRGDVPEVVPGRVLRHEAVGVPEAFETCPRTVRPGGRVADTGALKVARGGPQHNEIVAPAEP
ncbi:alcohol dehydrogenase catalytic domain-containing protein [Streptomyces sp. CLV115]|uniref:alcohol dehydrogenase catalytic domain-containing protein n=1 Tax=Streptomyces sp. CLV115 TaxID=3138502 RepID=UPI00406C8D72